MRALDFNTRTQVTRLVGRGAECGGPGICEGREEWVTWQWH